MQKEIKERPIRVQRKRTRGWRMPPNTVSVTRPGIWGNPYAGSDAAAKFRASLMDLRETVGDIDYKHMWHIRDTIHDLRGKNLACWCKEGEPCHADALLELANA